MRRVRFSAPELARFFLVGFQILRLAQTRLLRWRLETYGLYMPSLPSTRPWWRVNRRALVVLLRQRRAYGRWLGEMRAARTAAGPGWWRARLGDREARLSAYVAAANHDSSEDTGRVCLSWVFLGAKSEAGHSKDYPAP